MLKQDAPAGRTMTAAPYRFGTISFTYPDWKGSFYPKKAAADSLLERYARVFDFLEIDNTAYRAPKTEVVQSWVDQTPDAFTFGVKLRNSLTQPGKLADLAGAGAEEFGWFVDRLAPMKEAGKLGPIVALFPKWMRPDKYGDAFLAWLDALPQGYQWAIELRHASWRDPEAPYLEAMRARGAGLVWSVLDGLEVPEEMTADGWVYSRLMGDRELEKFDKIQRTRDDDITTWAAKQRALGSALSTSYVAVSNRFEGFAPQTVRRVQEALGATPTDLAPAAFESDKPTLESFGE